VHWAVEDCTGCLKLLALYEDTDFIYMILDFQPKGSLMTTLEDNMQFNEADVRVIMEQALLALDLFQKKHIVHRDIKLENILINQIEEKTKCEIRIADFGLAAFTPNDELITHKCGSPGYVAPEIFQKSGYSYKADVFSLGSVFFNLLTGRYLFSG
jgi:serine/threonine protein kinase